MSDLHYVFAKYNLNGTFAGWENVTMQFEFCQPTANKVPNWIKFGYGYTAGEYHTGSYSCNLFNLLSFPEPMFYDMYLVDYGSPKKKPVWCERGHEC